MDNQETLFKLGYEQVLVSVGFRPRELWVVSVRGRRQGDTWADDPGSIYSQLSRPEALDVVCSELEQLLGL